MVPVESRNELVSDSKGIVIVSVGWDIYEK